MSKTCLTFKPRICPTKMRLDDAFQPLAGVYVGGKRCPNWLIDGWDRVLPLFD
jgi:hypothetical protein